MWKTSMNRETYRRWMQRRWARLVGRPCTDWISLGAAEGSTRWRSARHFAPPAVEFRVRRETSFHEAPEGTEMCFQSFHNIKASVKHGSLQLQLKKEKLANRPWKFHFLDWRAHLGLEGELQHMYLHQVLGPLPGLIEVTCFCQAFGTSYLSRHLQKQPFQHHDNIMDTLRFNFQPIKCNSNLP